MQPLIVVHNPENWSFGIPGVKVVSGREYLTDPHYSNMTGVRVFNLCRSYRYLSIGYYVSLLAEARGHRPLPTINTIQDARLQAVVRIVAEDLDELVQRSLARVVSQRFTLSVYFGRNLARRHQPLSLRLFNLFPAPLLRAQFEHTENKWELQSIYTISSAEVPRSHRAFVEYAASEFFARRGEGRRRRRAYRYDLAILVNPKDENPPSDAAAIRRFVRAAEGMDMKAALIDRDDYGRLSEFDALFIRDTTYVNHYTYRFASRAQADGLVVIDDPVSIVRCTNKVFLAELLARHGIPTPQTTFVHDDNMEELAREVRYPCILKRPDGAFSRGVSKVDNEEEFLALATAMLEESDLVLAQEFLPTEFDWRIGILDRQPLYACRYWMAPKHWQVIQWDGSPQGRSGRWDTLPLEQTPKRVLRTALRAANLIGNGFYGVDLKEVGRNACVIEVNDNPNVDTGVEDRHLKFELYRHIMSVFLNRIDQSREKRST